MTKAKREAKLPAEKGPGRPSKYTAAVVDEICRRLMAGETMKTITADPDMPSETRVYEWLADEEKGEFRERYAHAREVQGEHSADLIRDTAKKVLTGEIGPNEARTAIDAFKWDAAHLKPKVYGDKVTAEFKAPGSVTFVMDLGGKPPPEDEDES